MTTREKWAQSALLHSKMEKYTGFHGHDEVSSRRWRWAVISLLYAQMSLAVFEVAITVYLMLLGPRDLIALTANITLLAAVSIFGLSRKK